MKKKENKEIHYGHGGHTLAAISGWHSLLALRSHGKISKEQFDRRSKKLKREALKTK